jgi:hypothetical protein
MEGKRMNNFNEQNTEEAVIVSNGEIENQVIGAVEEEEVIVGNPMVKDILKGGLLSFLVAVIAAFLWYFITIKTNYQLGIVSIAVGFIISKVLLFGTENKKGAAVQAIGIVAVVLAIIISEFLIQRHLFIEEGYEVHYFLSPMVYIEIIVETVKASPQSLMFWGIAIIEPVKMCSKKYQ